MGLHKDFIFKKYNIVDNLKLIGTILFYLVLIGAILYGAYFIAINVIDLIKIAGESVAATSSESTILSSLFSSESGSPSLILIMLIMPISFFLLIKIIGLGGYDRGGYL